MSTFLYYIGGVQGVPDKAKLEAAGLGYVFGGISYTARDCMSGPDKTRGVVLAPEPTKPGEVGYFKDKQTWRALPESSVWVGYYTENPPTPKELARKNMLDGHWIGLPNEDSEKWLCPVGRQFVIGDDGEVQGMACALPSALDLDENMQWVTSGIDKRYKTLWDDTCRVGDVIMGAVNDFGVGEGESGVVTVTIADEADMAVRALQTNYRIGKVEAVMLGLMTESSAARVAMALIDWPTYDAAIKKKAIAES